MRLGNRLKEKRLTKSPLYSSRLCVNQCVNSQPPPPHGPTAPSGGQGHLIAEALRSHSDIPHLVGLLWTSDRPDAETLATDRHPCPRRDSNPASKCPQPHALDRAASWVGQKMLLQIKIYLYPPNSTMGILQQVTVHFTLEEATKAQKGSRGIAILFL